jgi:hypothetical protein
MINHLCCHGQRFLIDLIVAKNFHLAAEQLRRALFLFTTRDGRFRRRS